MSHGRVYSLSLIPPIEPLLLDRDSDNPSVPTSAAYCPRFGLFCRFANVFLTFLSGLSVSNGPFQENLYSPDNDDGHGRV